MTRQALAAPIIAIWTEFLSPAVGRFGMFTIIAAFPFVSAIMNVCFFTEHPSPEKILNRIARLIPSELCVCHKTATEFFSRKKKMKVPPEKLQLIDEQRLLRYCTTFHFKLSMKNPKIPIQFC